MISSSSMFTICKPLHYHYIIIIQLNSIAKLTWWSIDIFKTIIQFYIKLKQVKHFKWKQRINFTHKVIDKMVNYLIIALLLIVVASGNRAQVSGDIPYLSNCPRVTTVKIYHGILSEIWRYYSISLYLKIITNKDQLISGSQASNWQRQRNSKGTTISQ